MFRFFGPHLRVDHVCQLTPARLEELGLEALLLDVDSTLKRYRAETVSQRVAAWLDELRGAGVALCLMSNGRGRRIGRLAETLGLPFVASAMKPLPLGIRRALREMSLERSRTAMVGDQLFADVLAARLAGVMAILVTPIRPEEEHWFTRIKRPPERLMLRGMGLAETEDPEQRGDRQQET